ncbi:MAG: hypothetical protein KAR06_10145 [Deltaproteobacteria bacterium]|nr:hypothetical protein [Deltaproteobacteria bacterium]
MERLLQSKYFHVGISALITALIFIVYSNTFNASFHFDDIPQIVENYLIRDLGNLGQILSGARGVTMATFALNYAVGGLDVTGYHIVNTLIHAVNAILAYFLVYNILTLITKDSFEWCKKIAAYSALIFAVHPIQTQSVTYIVQRMESLSSMFYLIALYLFIRAVKSSKSRVRVAMYVAVVFSFFLSFKSKEIAITLPALLLLMDYFFVSGRDLSKLISRWPVHGAVWLLFIYFAVSTVAPMGGFGDLSVESAGMGAKIVSPVGEGASAGFGVKSITPWEYLLTQFNVIVYYLALLLVPINQNLDYDFPEASGLFSTPALHEGTVLNLPVWPPVVSLIILVMIVAAAFWLFMKSKSGTMPRALTASFFIFWFFILISPTSSFIPIIDVIFEHRVYMASLGFFVIFSLCLDYIFSARSRSEKQEVSDQIK